MACIHNFTRSEAGEVSCSICHVFDDEMPQSETQHAKQLDTILDEKVIKAFLKKEEDFWSTQVSFE